MPRLVYASLLAASFLTACTHDQDTAAEPDPVACTGTTASASGRVVVQFREQLALGADPAPALWCRDDSRHPCGNYSLPYALTTAVGRLGVSFTPATAPTICLTNIDYAHSRIDLNSFATGSYAVTWQAGGRQTSGTLRVLPDRVEVNSCDSNTVAVRSPVTYRIPATTLWGQSYARTAAAQAAVAVVLDSLRHEGAVPLRLPAGHYSYFEVDATGQLVPVPALQNGQPASATTTPILLSYSGNFARIKALLKRKPQAADLSFELDSAHGETAF